MNRYNSKCFHQLCSLPPGSHAASVAVEVPSEVDHARAVVNMYLEQLKNSASQSLNHLDNTEFVKYK